MKCEIDLILKRLGKLFFVALSVVIILLLLPESLAESKVAFVQLLLSCVSLVFVLSVLACWLYPNINMAWFVKDYVLSREEIKCRKQLVS